jgi:catechol 2,3-dioxygenase-like lactoylglutathione lyase family enzyme
MSKFRNMRMKQIALVVAACCLGSSLVAQDQPVRPKITGIDHVRIFVTDIDKSRDFYRKLMTVSYREGPCDESVDSCLAVRWGTDESIELRKAPASGAKNWVAQIAFGTDDVKRMRAYMLAHGVAVSEISEQAKCAHFEVLDPQGVGISFVERFFRQTDFITTLIERLLHAGFVVNNMAAENHFYRDILGFRLYWRGGFHDDGLDWYEIQVPDGDYWIEYMLNIPANADHQELGVQNHFSFGVKDIHEAVNELRRSGLQKFDGPEIGRDGKWALDVYDPDGTRVELMEFAPVQKPCCHPYTAPHPQP